MNPEIPKKIKNNHQKIFIIKDCRPIIINTYPKNK